MSQNAGCVCDADPSTGLGDRQCNPYGSNQDADCCAYDANACSNSKLNTKSSWNYCDPMAGATAIKNTVSTPHNLPKRLIGIL